MEGDPFQLIGTAIDGKYRVYELVGEGGFGLVYRGFHLSFEQPIAIKCLKVPAHFTHEARALFLEKFREEGRLLAKLRHDAIVRVFDFGVARDSQVPYLILEWLTGEDLQQHLNRRGEPFTEQDAIQFLRPVVEAIGVAHRHGIAHRDIKPANIFLAHTDDGTRLRVLDFGIAKAMDEGETATQLATRTTSGFSAFSPQYGAPEQFRSKKFGATGPWTDVHALGLILVEMVAGRAPFEGEEHADFLLAAIDDKRPTPRALGAQVSDGFEQLCTRALALKPADRFQSAEGLLYAMDRAVVPVTVGTHGAEVPASPAVGLAAGSAGLTTLDHAAEQGLSYADTALAPLDAYADTAAPNPLSPPPPGRSAAVGGSTTAPTVATAPPAQLVTALPVSRRRPPWALIAGGLVVAGAVAAVVAVVALRAGDSSSAASAADSATTSGEARPGAVCEPGDLAACQHRCERGDGESCANLARIYERGLGVTKDQAKAVRFYREACDHGAMEGCTSLGFLYAGGTGVEKNDGEAVRLYRKACAGGNARGCNNLGFMYAMGHGVTRDDQRALPLYRKACDGGYAHGCRNLGRLYEQGEGGVKNNEKAAQAYREACDRGNMDGCTSLGFLYAGGTGVEKSDEQAVRYYRKGCDGGDARGCNNLGWMYAVGHGVTKDDQEAMRLYRKACAGGYTPACDSAPK